MLVESFSTPPVIITKFEILFIDYLKLLASFRWLPQQVLELSGSRYTCKLPEGDFVLLKKVYDLL